MTALGNSRTYGALTASTDLRVDIVADFANPNTFGGEKEVIHVAFWIKNLSVTPADVIWYRLDDTVATVEGNDCYPLAPGERVYVRKVYFMHFISAGTPKFTIAGDQSGIVYS